MAERVEVGGKDWARRIIADYEAGKRVRQVALRMAMDALGLKPGTVIVRGRQPAFDARMLAAGGE